VIANDIEDLIKFNLSKQKMILTRIEKKFKESGIEENNILEEVK